MRSSSVHRAGSRIQGSWEIRLCVRLSGRDPWKRTHREARRSQLVHIELLSEGTNRRSLSRTDATLPRLTGFFLDIIRGQAVKGRISQERTTPETVLNPVTSVRQRG